MLSAVLVLLIAETATAYAQTDSARHTDTVAATEAAQRFHALLAAGDSANVAALLADDAIIVESGDVETRAQYLAHHLSADIEFARAVPSRRNVLSVSREGDVVWIVSSSVAAGSFRGRQIESRGAELMVVAKTNGMWRLRAVHWSSQPRRPTPPGPASSSGERKP